MPEAKVTLVFQVSVSRVQAFIDAMTDRAEEVADLWRCPNVAKGDDLRCQLDRDHGGDRHVHDRFSWPVAVEDGWTPPKTVATGHIPCPSPGSYGTCEKSLHHHWRSSTGVDWIMPGRESACGRDHLAEWEQGKL